MPEFLVMIGDTTIDMTADIKSAKSKKDIKKALVKALKAGTKKEESRI